MGSSVVDYVIVSSKLFEIIVDFEVMARVESNHLPLGWLVKCGANNRYNTYNHPAGNSYHKRYKWKDIYRESYIACFE